MSNTIYVPSFPGSSGATGILPGFKQGGFGSGGGGAPSFPAIELPQTGIMNTTADYTGNTAKYVQYVNPNAIGTDDSTTSSLSLGGTSCGAILGTSSRASRLISNHQYTLIYGGCSPIALAEGGTKRFSLSTGLRVMWLLGNYGGGSNRRGIDHMVGFTLLSDGRSSGTYGYPLSYVRGRLYGNEVNPARFYLDHKPIDGENIALGYSSITALDLRDQQYWCAVGLEIPPSGIGNLTVVAKVWGKTYAPGFPVSWSSPCPDLSAYAFDAPYHYSRAYGRTTNGSNAWLFTAAWWVGSSTDPWPWAT